MWMFVVFAASLVVAFRAMPKPQSQPPAGLGDIRAPTAQEGREVPVLFGTRILSGPNIVWYGHLRTVAIKKKGGKK